MICFDPVCQNECIAKTQVRQSFSFSQANKILVQTDIYHSHDVRLFGAMFCVLEHANNILTFTNIMVLGLDFGLISHLSFQPSPARL